MQEKVILSLSTIPPRFGMLGKSLNSLINQKRRADEIHVYVPKIYRRFPEHTFSKPEVPEGVNIKIVDTDYGPATKVLPCALEYRGTNARIVYGDDDRFADISWLDEIMRCSNERPMDVVVSAGMTLQNYGLTVKTQNLSPRAKRKKVKYDLNYLTKRFKQKTLEIITKKSQIKPVRCHYASSGYVDFALGLGGVSVRPDFFDDKFFEIPDVLWAVDDIWLSGNFMRQGRGIWASNKIKMPVDTGAGNISGLAYSVIEGHDRFNADRLCISYMKNEYGIWK
ncbi:hypothetical protein N9V26_03665 [Amylibacter sp.]|nr:hypothetical protein [Amylibacter sp.]MDB2321140.1 hypothetical protein [Amylibacter sp.]